jgi:hypothetical protein
MQQCIFVSGKPIKRPNKKVETASGFTQIKSEMNRQSVLISHRAAAKPNYDGM